MSTQDPDEINTSLPPKAKFFPSPKKNELAQKTTGRRFLLFGPELIKLNPSWVNGKATHDAQIGCPRNHGLTKISHESERWYHKT